MIGNDPESEANAQIRELRDSRIAPDVARQAAEVFGATVTIVNDLGAEVARESPQDPDALEGQGLRLDPEVGPSRKRVELELPNGEQVRYQVIVSDLYSNRGRRRSSRSAARSSAPGSWRSEPRW